VSGTTAGDDPAYRDPTLGVLERVADLLGRMTRDEKIAQLCGIWLTLDPGGGEVAPYQGMFSQGGLDPEEKLRHGIGQLTRPLGSAPVAAADGARMVNELQRRMVEETRLGIPVLAHDECLTGYMTLGATSFPAPLNWGSTWHPELVAEVAAAIRDEMRSTGARQGLAPVADVIRDARWGRVEECIAEDPYLVGVMVSAYVRGLQGTDLTEGVVATPKHFAGYAASEGGRNFAPAHVGPREMADVYLVPFEMAIKEAGARSVMNAYQDVDGEPAASSRHLLTEVLRERWGFDGTVVSDYYAVSFLHMLHHTASGPVDAAAAALRAGIDVELPNPDCYPELGRALDEGLLTDDDLDLAVERVLRTKFELGLFESPYVDPDAVELNRPEARALARQMAEESIVLLANDGVLPLGPTTAVAVIGPNADDPLALFGNYSYQRHVASHLPDAPTGRAATTLLDAFRERFDHVTAARGCDVTGIDTSGFDEAVTLAGEADVAVVVVGDTAGHFRQGTVGEGTDTDDLSLPGVQQQLVDAVVATSTPTVVVLVNGRPFALARLAEQAAAVVEAWFPGEEGAGAVADVVSGAVNPSGRTTVTFSRSAGAQPLFYNQKRLARGVPDSPHVEAVWPFGHGLSYTTFEYGDLTCTAEAPVDGTLTVTCTVTNRGTRAGTEVAQLYVRDDTASVTRPIKELKGFARVSLPPDGRATVTFTIPVDLLSFTGLDGRRIVEPGTGSVMVGASSADIRLQAPFELVGDVRVVGEDRALTSSVHVDLA
jgi:beta-glucosidase